VFALDAKPAVSAPRALLLLRWSHCRDNGSIGTFWHDPAHVLVSIFAGRQPKPFGAFLTLAV
jgi:hypothetical protein